jgi:hypothetical protein
MDKTYIVYLKNNPTTALKYMCVPILTSSSSTADIRLNPDCPHKFAKYEIIAFFVARDSSCHSLFR